MKILLPTASVITSRNRDTDVDIATWQRRNVHFSLDIPNITQGVARNPKLETRKPWLIFMPQTRTWRFDVKLQMAVLSLHEDVSDVFNEILYFDSARYFDSAQT